jgi:hypothetical protein
MGFFYRREEPTMPRTDDKMATRSCIYRPPLAQRRRLQQKVVIDSLRPISRYCRGQITQIEVFPLNDSYVPYCVTFKTSEGTLTMNADRRMLRELYRVLRAEFRPTTKGVKRCRELA